MKKIITAYTILFALLLTPLVATSTRVKHTGKRKVLIEDSRRYTLNSLTVYHPTKKQCDKTPLITASNSRINIEELKNQNIRWMALSRDLLKRWKGEFHYGDTVRISSGDAGIDGLWVIKDTMNKRFKNRGDLLFDKSVRNLGKWENVQISRVSQITL